MAREGAALVVADLDGEAGAETARRIEQAGGRALAVETDVGDDSQLDALVARTLETFGRIDILHSHAGIQVEGPLETVDPDGMDASWHINVRAHFRLTRLLMRHMRTQGGGSIIVTSSNSGVLYDHEMIAYATSKHAAVAMVKQIAIDYGKYNVRVNALCPGWVDTPLQRRLHPTDGRPREAARLREGEDPDGTLRERRGNRRGDPVPGIGPLVIHDGACARHRRRRVHSVALTSPLLSPRKARSACPGPINTVWWSLFRRQA
jgi:NAD(P)-dependent dehydrogenase (short-subunit alcohol dehydrogenase family)